MSEPTPPDDSDAPTTPRAALLVTAIAVIALERLVPFGRLILYPFTLLATWVHEMGHGLTAILVGGSFEKLEIFGDASGLAHCSSQPGVREALVSMGGLLAPPLVGAALLTLGRGPRRARVLLWLLAGALALSLAVWVRSSAGWLSMVPLSLLVAAVARFGGRDGRLLFAQFLGVLLALDTVTRIDYLFTAGAKVGGVDRPSDVANVARALGGHHLAWGTLLAAISLVLLAAGLWAAWRRPRAAVSR
ncbi:MAG: M50 family peptidase [Myxococcales bacterium]|nr:M50 family peptidase [Myxococcales bacterium]